MDGWTASTNRRLRPETWARAVGRDCGDPARIGASSDLDTVPREAGEGARAFTGARYGAIYAPTVPDNPADFVTSGLTPEEHGALAAWFDECRLCEHLRDPAVPRSRPDLAD